jgi:hypothetical protein
MSYRGVFYIVMFTIIGICLALGAPYWISIVVAVSMVSGRLIAALECSCGFFVHEGRESIKGDSSEH